MKHFKKVFKSKKPSPAIHGPMPTTTSALIPSISASGATEEVIHQATGVSVGLQEIKGLPPVSAQAAGINSRLS